MEEVIFVIEIVIFFTYFVYISTKSTLNQMFSRKCLLLVTSVTNSYRNRFPMAWYNVSIIKTLTGKANRYKRDVKVDLRKTIDI